jgi:hypothetical protein
MKQWDIGTNQIVEMPMKTLQEVKQWTGQDPGRGGELIRWSANSDKWFLQQVGWYGHAMEVAWGSNQLLLNWSDGEAIITSANPRNNKEDINSIFYCNTAGDFWVQGPEGKLETAEGQWADVQEVGPVVGLRMINEIPLINSGTGIGLYESPYNSLHVFISRIRNGGEKVFDINGKSLNRSEERRLMEQTDVK